jgi:hypothetical protein
MGESEHLLTNVARCHDNKQNYTEPTKEEVDYSLFFDSPFICKLYRYCKITRGMKRSAQ